MLLIIDILLLIDSETDINSFNVFYFLFKSNIVSSFLYSHFALHRDGSADFIAFFSYSVGRNLLYPSSPTLMAEPRLISLL